MYKAPKEIELLDLTAESVYKAMVLPKTIYYSNPVLKLSDTMANKIERLKKNAMKIIHNQSTSCRDCALITILNQKKCKAAIMTFKCLQGTAIPYFASYIT